jgi:serine/threonine protein kinase
MDSSDSIYLTAREISDPAERAAYLNQACGSDADLRATVERMVRDAERADAFFQTQDEPAPARGEVDAAGSMIGRYKLLQKIGEGGMGVVYMAEQREPVVRKVALKIIKAGMDTRQVVARFEAERQALALMDHPNIAKVFDGGATGDPHSASGHPLPSDGRGAGGEGHPQPSTLNPQLASARPYFVMELVQGLPITQFCDEAKLSTRERLDLFLEVCSAIQHAHQKGIIHRDLKPSNILVTLHGDKPVPKVIDFGVAKATQQRLTDKTLFTQFQHFIGTPAYMSPEQASLSGLDIDTRSDIYALGVLLYELLTGTTPFDGKEMLKSGLDEMRRTIREKEPPRPSLRLISLSPGDLTTTAERRRIEGPRLISALRGDLDWVVMKSLEKDRARRYETANGFAADVRHYLNDEAVVARPPSVAYRFAKTVARHKIAFAGATAVFASLVSGFTVSTWLFLKERDARLRALAAEKQQAELRLEAEAARRKAEAGKTALLYWQAFDALPRVTPEEQRRLRSITTIDQPAELAARYNEAFKLLRRAMNIGSGCDWGANVEDGGPETWVPNYRHVRHATDAALLRAHVALSEGNPDEARRDLLSVFVLARHAAIDGTLVTIMAQCEVESKVVEYLAQCFEQFPLDQMIRLTEELRAAPPRVDVARGAQTEQGGTRWIIREIQRAQLKTPGDEATAILRVRASLAEWIGPGAWADQTIAAAGDTSAGLIAYIRQTAPYYELLQRVAVATPGELRVEATNVAAAIERSTNHVVQRILPNLERARRREMETLARLAMLEAASAFRRKGQAGLQSVRDPFGNGPLAYRPTDAGFELRSALADHGFNGSLDFLTGKVR